MTELPTLTEKPSALDERSRAVAVARRLGATMAPRASEPPYQAYERIKAALTRDAQTSAEYEAAVRLAATLAGV